METKTALVPKSLAHDRFQVHSTSHSVELTLIFLVWHLEHANPIRRDLAGRPGEFAATPTSGDGENLMGRDGC